MHVIEQAAHSSSKAAQGLRVRSALNPLLWLCAIATPICAGAAYLFRGAPWIAGVFASIAVLPVVTACAGYVYFALRMPDKLQSEDYQLRHETLQIIQLRGNASTVDPAVLERIAATPRHILPPGQAE